MKKFYLIAFIIFLSATAFAQSPSSILKKAEKALGGKKNLSRVSSVSSKGKITRDGSAGKIEILTKRDNLYYIAFDIDGFETEAGFNGRSAWLRDSRDGLKTLTGEESSAMQAEAVFRNSAWLNYKKERAKIASCGKAQIEQTSANCVQMTTPKGITAKLYFSTADNLIIREERPSSLGDIVVDYSNYKTVGAVKMPYTQKLKIDDKFYHVEFDEITLGQNIDVAKFSFPKISGEPLPDITALLKQVGENSEVTEKILDDYSYNQIITTREPNKDGSLRVVESETRELSFYKGYRITRLVEKNGKPLSPKDQEKEDKETQERVEEIEKEIAKKERSGETGDPRAGQRISLSELFKASRLVNPRRERFKGRDVIVFDFEPNPDFDYKNAKSVIKFFGKTAGVIWIDEKDKQVARVEAYLADSFNYGGGVLAKLRKGASFTLDQDRINDEIWLPSNADINMSIRVLLVKGLNINQNVRSYNYRKFSTEIKDAEVISPPETK